MRSQRSRHGLASHALVGLATVLLLGGCQTTGDIGGGPPGLPAGEVDPEGMSLSAIFEGAAKEFDVPVSLLQSIAWSETQWQMVVGEEEIGLPPAYGIMALSGAKLHEGALRAGVTVEEAKTDVTANVRAAAAMLSIYAEELHLDRSRLSDWAPAVADYSGIDELPGRQAYVHAAVYDVLQTGVVTEAMTLSPVETIANFPLSDANLAPGPDYAGSVWRSSPNYSARPGGKYGTAAMVIIHDCEGSYAGCWSWLSNSAAKASAHYVVNSSGSEISQLVREKNKAWHIAADYQCSLNSKQKCDLNNYGCNGFTVGIEHAGFASQKVWDKGLLSKSAKLTCDITKDLGIPRDKYHIVGHGQLQPYNRTDPGPNWPWGEYLKLVSDACNGNAPPPPPNNPPPNNPPPNNAPLVIVVDSNAAQNSKNALFVASSSWTASNNVAGFYHTGYWWRKVGASSDSAEFRAHLPKAMKMQVHAWWTAASDRSTKAPFLIYDAGQAQLDKIYVNQQQNGGKWSHLGSYSFKAGWIVVVLSRWTSGGGVVVADAVRFSEVP